MLLSLKKIFRKHKIVPRGVLHIGASEGQEAPEYARHGIKNMLFIEALPEVYQKLKENISVYPDAIAIQECIGEENGKEVTFNVADNGGQSSSYLEFGTHSKEHPDVHFTRTIQMKTKRIDSIYQELSIQSDKYDFLNMDLQGAELFALRGMGDLLSHFKWAYLEVNEKELYKGCAMIGEIDSYLRKYEFKRAETKMTNWGWGDALYKK